MPGCYESMGGRRQFRIWEEDWYQVGAGGLKSLVGNKEQMGHQVDPFSLKGRPVSGSQAIRHHYLRILLSDRWLPVPEAR